MKNLLLTVSLIGNIILFYQHFADKADLYDTSKRAQFFQNKVGENPK